MLLTAKPSDFHIAPVSELPHVWATLIEMRMSGVMVSLAAVADGTTSLYFSNGGGIIGGGGHESVRAANRKLLTFVETGLDLFVPLERPLEVVDAAVSFAVLTYEGLRGARDEEVKLKERRSPLWPAFYLGHDVIAALRLTEQKSEG
ncbi:MAG: hypothetical protein ACRDF9_15290 [Candidatus Limnocylindria bacterium]